VIGAALGPVAAILLTAVVTPYAMILENRVGNAIVSDPTALARFQNVTIATVVVDGLGSMAGSGASEIMTSWATKMSKPYIEKIANKVIQTAGTFSVQKVSEMSSEAVVGK
jgi:hypothetical protein